MKIRSVLTNLALTAASLLVGLLIAELGARLFLNPSDYLSVQMVQDEKLGAVPSAATKAGGFDAWGFRNPEIPSTADIVVIGDSHTFGNTATMEDSWPYVLGRLTGKRVYNMGMGGYGPNQYYQLFLDRALSLKPSIIVIGLYMGDDFENAFLITYGLDYWSRLRTLPAKQVNFDIWESESAPSWDKKIRIWLSRHSVLYQVVVHGPVLGRLQGETQIRNAALLSPEVASINLPEKNILEAFRPKGIARNLDQDSEWIREGMRITFHLLEEMSSISKRNGIELVVALIPTKETVFAEYLDASTAMALHDVIGKVLVNERRAMEKTIEFLNQANIQFVDTLPALRGSLDKELYARTAADMHPNRNGYRVIAEAVFAALTAKENAKGAKPPTGLK